MVDFGVAEKKDNGWLMETAKLNRFSKTHFQVNMTLEKLTRQCKC